MKAISFGRNAVNSSDEESEEEKPENTTKVMKVQANSWKGIMKDSREQKEEVKAGVATEQAGGFFLDFGASSLPNVPSPEPEPEPMKTEDGHKDMVIKKKGKK